MTAAGIALALAASVAYAFATAIEAGEDRKAPLRRGGRLSLFLALARRPRWLAGTGLMILAWPLQILALTFAPITVVQPLLSTTQLVLLAVARTKLKERVGRREALGALAIVAGVAVVVWAAPRRTVHDPAGAALAVVLGVVGLAAAGAYVAGRAKPRAQLMLVVGAGLAYAWVDFVNKLLADDLSSSHWVYAALWLAATLIFGTLAFLEENTALQRRPSVTVAPVIGAVHDPLPVLMALAAGVESWGNAARHIAPLIAGLAVIAAGAVLLGRSEAVARISSDPRDAAGTRRRLAACARSNDHREHAPQADAPQQGRIPAPRPSSAPVFDDV
jgi:drug/metabolite transporter (DMT)-like permease